VTIDFDIRRKQNGVMMLRPNMSSFNDQEGLTVPAGFPPVIDAHARHSIIIFSAFLYHIRIQLLCNSRLMGILE